jgi:hypothetical protein
MHTMPADPNLLQALTDAHAARLAATRAELEAVAALRTAGATWQEIADATGLKHRQQAEKKYARCLVEVEPGARARWAVAEGAEGTLRLS